MSRYLLNPCILIRYKPQVQLTIEGFEYPFHQQLGPTNRWVMLAARIPWAKLANMSYKSFRSPLRPPILDARVVNGAVIIKYVLNIGDREVVEQIVDNIYPQYFVALSGFQRTATFDASLMETIPRRLWVEVMDQFNTLVLQGAGIIPSVESDDQEKEDSDGGSGSKSDVREGLGAKAASGWWIRKMLRELKSPGRAH